MNHFLIPNNFLKESGEPTTAKKMPMSSQLCVVRGQNVNRIVKKTVLNTNTSCKKLNQHI